MTSEILSTIARTILSSSNQNYGLYQGKTGELLFLTSLEQHFPGLVAFEDIQQHFSAIVKSVPQLPQPLSLAEGVTGVAYVFEHLSGFQPELRTLNDSFDQLLFTTLTAHSATTELELTKGIAGLLLYLYERRDKDFARKAASLLLSELEQRAIWLTDSVCSWPTPQNSMFRLRKNSPGYEFNLGLAHGMPGIIAALLLWMDDWEFGARAGRLVCGGCDWLFEQQADAEVLGAYYPELAQTQVCSRLGWCYGDLGIALLLGKAAVVCQRPRYFALGQQIAAFSAQRFGAAADVTNPALCHGSAGVSLMFQLLDQVYPQTELRTVADFWYQQTFKDPMLSCLLHAPSETAKYSTGLLNGYAGIGLTMLSTVTGHTDWVSCLGLRFLR